MWNNDPSLASDEQQERDCRSLGAIYTFLYAASIVAIFPWGTTRGEIWTAPKVYVLVAIALTNFGVLMLGSRTPEKPPLRWWGQASLWSIFLAVGYISASASPYADRAFSGELEMQTGWMFWAIVAAAALSNSLVLRLHPCLLRAQVYGWLLGGGLLAIGCIPQVIHWKIDYTITSGQTLPDYEDNILASYVARDFQPIGFYSHRGHNAIVLAQLFLMTIVARRWRWIPTHWFWPLAGTFGVMLLLARTRAAFLACVLGLLLMWGWRYRRQIALACVTLALMVGTIAIASPGADIPSLVRVSSDRVFLWQVASRAIAHRPIFGWGFDGLSLAYPWSHSATWKPDVIEIDRYWFLVRTPKGDTRRFTIPSSKAHNQVLDTLVSVGIAGAVPFFGLCVLSLYGLSRSPAGIWAPVAIAYLAFTTLWFDCAQYAYGFWWIVSLEFWSGSTDGVALPSPISAATTTPDDAIEHSKNDTQSKLPPS